MRTAQNGGEWQPPPQFEEYRVLRKLGAGAMGEVFLGHDTLLERPVAIKFVGKPGEDIPPRFLTEARAAARLQHPNVVGVYRVGQLSGRAYIVTEYVQGKSLEQLARPVAWADVARLGIGLARGLAAAHRQGVLHRDIKPANALITDEGDVKLADFGLAKLDTHVDEAAAAGFEPKPVSPSTPLLDSLAGHDATISDAPLTTPSQDRSASTQAGAILGTPAYLAPEVWGGQPASFASDQYSLGVLLYELVSGRVPHRGATVYALALSVTEEDAPPLRKAVRDIHPRFAKIVHRCLARDPTQRYPSVDALREALEALLAEQTKLALPEGNPYRGLMPFDAAHRALFFGRAAEVRTVSERLRYEPFVMVAAESGIGKSSLCRAGVLPAVEEGALGDGLTWRSVTMVPGRAPLATLVGVLARRLGCKETELDPLALGRDVSRLQPEGEGTIILVNQLEEMLTLAAPDERERAAEAMASLAQGTPGVRMLATVRGDYLTRLAALPRLGELAARGVYVLRPLGREAVRETIVGPARAKDVRFESEEMVESLVADASATLGGLPLLQFALAELWEHRDAEAAVITHAALERVGGVAGALARHADDVLGGLPAGPRAAARRILLRLVTSQGTRARVPWNELAVDAPSQEALEALVRGRLVVTREEEVVVVELAHEALIAGWSTLRNWIDEQAGSRVVQERIAAAALEWDRSGRRPEALWDRRRVAEADAVVAFDDLGERERGFLSASFSRARWAVRRRWLAGAALVLVAVAGVGVMRWQAGRELAERVGVHVRAGEATLLKANGLAGELAALRAEVDAHYLAGDPEAGEAAWAEVLARRPAADAAYAQAGQAFEAALRLDDTAAVRARYAEILMARASLAEAAGQPEVVDELVHRLALYDGRGAWNQPGRLTVTSTPPGAEVSIAGGRALGRTPLAAVELPAGTHALVVGGVAAPVRLGRGEAVTVDLALAGTGAVPDGFAYVPAGRFLFGSDDVEPLRKGFYRTAPLHQRTTPAFLIARRETTFAAWIEYLDALPAEERELRRPKVGTRGVQGFLELSRAAGGWQLTLQPRDREYRAGGDAGAHLRYEGRAARAEVTWLELPVTGLSFDDAVAYTTWLSRTGRVPGARPCREDEWERAARGADDRTYPHGDALVPSDANYDETYDRSPTAQGPDAVGSFPQSRSPFGLDDMAGNAIELTRSVFPGVDVVGRGGAYYYDVVSAAIPNRYELDAKFRDATLGLRVCADAPALK